MICDAEETEENDCCGNGCKNCVVSKETRKLATKSKKNKINLFASYKHFQLYEKTFLLPNILRLKFKFDPKGAAVDDLTLELPVGQHLMMRKKPPENIEIGGLIYRPYTPFSVDSDNLQFDILVNTSPDGLMTKYINNLKLDDSVEFRGVLGSFVYEANTYKNLLLFCNGVAVAPMIRIIKEILDNEEDNTRIHLNCCFQNLENILFRDEIYEYRSYWNFSGNLFLSRHICLECNSQDLYGSCTHLKNKLKYNENITSHRLDKTAIEAAVNNLNSSSYKIILCGSKQFEEFLVNTLCSINCSLDDIIIL